MYKAKTLWESEGKTPDGNPFSSVKEARGYYTYLSRGGVDSVFFILHDKNTRKFALINESKPPMDESADTLVRMTTAFGGSIDSKSSLVDITIQEVLEEAGYVVTADRVYSVGSTLVSSQMDQMAHGFIVDVTDIEKTHATESELEGATDEFSGNEVIWLKQEDVVKLNDWKSIFILIKAAISGVSE